VQDAALVCVAQTLADLEEELDAPGDRESVLVGVLDQALACHVFHHEEWVASLGRSSVVHARDAAMAHHRQSTTLGFETIDDVSGVHARLDDLESHEPAQGLGLLRQVDDSHASFAQNAYQLVGSHAIPGTQARSRSGRGGVRAVGGVLQESGRVSVGTEELLDTPQEGLVFPAQLAQLRLAPRRLDLEGGEEELLRACQVFAHSSLPPRRVPS